MKCCLFSTKGFLLCTLYFALCTLFATYPLQAEENAGRPDIVLSDFEADNYGDWTAEGTAFSGRNATVEANCGLGPVFGFHGKRLITTYAAPGNDTATGTLTSPEFKLERKYIAFLIGGGNFPGETGIALYVDGKQVAQETGLFNVSGAGNEGLVYKSWDVTQFAGKTAKVVIFDKKAGGDWGHIKVDYVYQTDVKPSSVANSVTFNKDVAPKEYDKMIFGQFIEHFHRQVYGGIFEPGSPLSDEKGFRKDVAQALRDIKTPIVRWPGGCFVSAYHWYKAIGPNRIAVYDKAWHVEDPNTFGTAEYVEWCRLIGAEPYICTNAGTGTMEEMSDWVEYCNLNIGEYGRLRQQHGYKEPFNVKYWSVGNENWGGHEMGAKTVSEWGPLVRESSKLMLNTDSNIKLLAAATANESWTLPLLNNAGHLLSYVSIHGYWDSLWRVNNPSPYIACMMRTQAPENDIVRTIAILDKAKLRGRVFIAFDEWNLRGWHHPGHGSPVMDIPARDKNDINSTYTMADALFTACFLNSCLKHCDDVKMACFSPVVNARGAIYAYPKGIVKRTTYHVFWMYTNLLEKNVLPVNLQSEILQWNRQSTPKFDVVLSVNDDKTHYVIAIVNKDPANATELKIDFATLCGTVPAKVSATVLSGSSPDDYNDVGAENRVVPEKKTLKVKDGCVTIQPHSLTFIELTK